MNDFASLRRRMEAYLGRSGLSQTEVLFGMHEVMAKAEADRADADAYRALLADTRHRISVTPRRDLVLVHPLAERLDAALWDACPAVAHPPTLPRGKVVALEEGEYFCSFRYDGISTTLYVSDPPTPTEEPTHG